MPYVLFFLAGVGLGFAAPGAWKLLPLAFPLGIAAITAFKEGLDGTGFARLVLALAVTAVGVVAGAVMERRAAPAARR